MTPLVTAFLLLVLSCHGSPTTIRYTIPRTEILVIYVTTSFLLGLFACFSEGSFRVYRLSHDLFTGPLWMATILVLMPLHLFIRGKTFERSVTI